MIELFEVDSDCEVHGYRSEDGVWTMKREQGRAPNGNEINGRWVLRENGEWKTVGRYRNDVDELFNLQLDVK